MTPETTTRLPRATPDVPRDVTGHEGQPISPGSPQDVGVHSTVSTAIPGHPGMPRGHPGAPLTLAGPPEPATAGPTSRLPT